MILSIRGILSALILDILGEIWGIFAMADPDFQIRGGGGHPDAEIGAGEGRGAVLKDIFSALRASV